MRDEKRIEIHSKPFKQKAEQSTATQQQQQQLIYYYLLLQTTITNYYYNYRYYYCLEGGEWVYNTRVCSALFALQRVMRSYFFFLLGK